MGSFELDQLPQESSKNRVAKSRKQQPWVSNVSLPNVHQPGSKLNQSFNGQRGQKSRAQVNLPTIQQSVNKSVYKKQIYGYGMSNQHSAYSLQHSVPMFAFPKQQRFSEKKYEGYQSMHYKPASDFQDFSDRSKSELRQLKGKIKGPHIGYG